LEELEKGLKELKGLATPEEQQCQPPRASRDLTRPSSATYAVEAMGQFMYI